MEPDVPPIPEDLATLGADGADGAFGAENDREIDDDRPNDPPERPKLAADAKSPAIKEPAATTATTTCFIFIILPFKRTLLSPQLPFKSIPQGTKILAKQSQSIVNAGLVLRDCYVVCFVRIIRTTLHLICAGLSGAINITGFPIHVVLP